MTAADGITPSAWFKTDVGGKGKRWRQLLNCDMPGRPIAELLKPTLPCLIIVRLPELGRAACVYCGHPVRRMHFYKEGVDDLAVLSKMWAVIADDPRHHHH